MVGGLRLGTVRLMASVILVSGILSLALLAARGQGRFSGPASATAIAEGLPAVPGVAGLILPYQLASFELPQFEGDARAESKSSPAFGRWLLKRITQPSALLLPTRKFGRDAALGAAPALAQCMAEQRLTTADAAEVDFLGNPVALDANTAEVSTSTT